MNSLKKRNATLCAILDMKLFNTDIIDTRGVVTGVVGVVLTTPVFEKIKGTCIKMLHLNNILTP